MRIDIASDRDHSALRRILVIVTATLVALAGLTLSTTVAATPAQAGSTARAVYSDFDSEVVYWTNVARAKRGLRPLKAVSCTDGFATSQTRRMATQNRMYHQPLRPVLRKCNLRTAGENLAWRSPSMSGKQVVAMWMGSKGHRANILAKKYKYIGVSAWKSRSGRVYAGQVFGG